MARRKTATERGVYRKRRRERLWVELVSLLLTPKLTKYLLNQPHPKIDAVGHNNYTYVEWLLDNGHAVKAYHIVKPIFDLLNEPEPGRVNYLHREIENVGVPRTYR